MAKASAIGLAARAVDKAARRPREGGAKQTRAPLSDAQTAPILDGKARFEAVMNAAEKSGLLGDKSGRIGGRVSPALVRQAKLQTGIEADSDLIEFALATIALEDHFAEAFKKSRGTVDPELKLGF